MDQVRQWNPFIKLLVKHKISNLILFLISFSYSGSDGDRNRGGRGAVDKARLLFQRQTDSSIKIRGERSPGFWMMFRCVCVGLTDKVTAGLLGGRADVRDPCLKFPIFWHLQPTAPERLLRRLIKRPSEWDCLTAATINNHSQHPDQEMCRQSSPPNN